MLGYLTLMSIFAVIFTLTVLGFLFTKKNFREIFYYMIAGFLVAFADLILEYLGTHSGSWNYNESLYFIFGTIPIELFVIFFSSGIIARFIFINYNKMKIPVKSNIILGILITIAFAFWFRQMYLLVYANILPLMILVGLFGIINISKRNMDGAVVLALFVALVDLISETVIIGSGSYDYARGFNIYVPMCYALGMFGFLAVLEKMHKLDALLEHSLIKKILKLFGVYRNKYTAEFDRINKKMKGHIKNGKKMLNKY